jgi:ribosomal protein L11 methyltransferase
MIVSCNEPVGDFHAKHEVERHILSILEEAGSYYTQCGLVKAVRERISTVPREMVRCAVKSMVLSGVLAYVHKCGSTCLALRPSGALRVSDRIVLQRDSGPDPLVQDGIVVRLASGASFGAGDHPTTRLALRGLDFAVAQLARRKLPCSAAALDIGTGSGVLAIAAAKLGVGQVMGIDNDPVACHEALANAKANDLRQKVNILYGTLAEFSAGPFDLLLANLRPPTLAAILDRMIELMNPEGGYWILSGFREQERSALISVLPNRACEMWSATEKTWCAEVFHLAPDAGAL